MRRPEVAGILTAGEVLATGESIAAGQRADGAIGWPDGHIDAWNHTECAMALSACGLRGPARRAYEWLRTAQRGDGSWPRRVAGGADGCRADDADDADDDAESNHAAYPAVGVWHELLVTGDVEFAERMWPMVFAGIGFALGLQRPRGEICWQRPAGAGRPAEPGGFALLAGNASMYQSLRCAIALARRLDRPQPGWQLAAARLGHAVACHPEAFADKSRFAMDWYYPVLAGPVRGAAAAARLAGGWDDFVVPGLGVRCVADQPWVTGAETCELVLALDALGDRPPALGLFAQIQRLRAPGGGYWTGWQYANRAHFPAEQSSWTAAAIILAADALSGATGGSGIFWDAGSQAAVARAAGPAGAAACGCGDGSPAQPGPAATRSSTRSDPVARTSANAPEASARR